MGADEDDIGPSELNKDVVSGTVEQVRNVISGTMHFDVVNSHSTPIYPSVYARLPRARIMTPAFKNSHAYFRLGHNPQGDRIVQCKRSFESQYTERASISRIGCI